MADEVTRGAARLAALIAAPLALLAGLVAFAALGGFDRGHPAPSGTPDSRASAPVTMAAPSLSAGDATICRAFIAELPARLRDLARHPVTAGAEQNAAYGDPPVTVACGAGPVPPVPPDAFVPILSGVCWYADQSRTGATVWTTLDRQVPVQVTMPNSYRGQGDWMQEFSAPIVASVPSLSRSPRYCVAPSTAPS